MKVELLNKPTLEFIDSAIGKCYQKGNYFPDKEKASKRINNVCNIMKHSSMLRFVNYVFDVEISTSILLEASRHQVGLDNAFSSTRYCIKNMNIKYEMSNNQKVNELLEKQKLEVIEFIKNNPDAKKDDLKLLLHQSFIYEGQMQFNAQSLQHFLKMRTDRGAHFHIIAFAKELYSQIPEDHKFLFEDCVYNSKDKIDG